MDGVEPGPMGIIAVWHRRHTLLLRQLNQTEIKMLTERVLECGPHSVTQFVFSQLFLGKQIRIGPSVIMLLSVVVKRNQLATTNDNLAG